MYFNARAVYCIHGPPVFSILGAVAETAARPQELERLDERAGFALAVDGRERAAKACQGKEVKASNLGWIQPDPSWILYML